MNSDRRIEQCICCGVYFHATDGGVYAGNRNGEPEYMCARCATGECDCEEDDDDKEERRYSAYVIKQSEIDDELVNFVVGLIDVQELAKRLRISEEAAQELIAQRVHVLSLPPDAKEAGE